MTFEEYWDSGHVTKTVDEGWNAMAKNIAQCAWNAALHFTPPTYAQGQEKPLLQFNLAQATALLECFGGEDALVTVSLVSTPDKGHSGVGLYAHYTDYPEEGSIFLGDGGSALPIKEGE